METDKKQLQIALTLINGIGPKLARQAVAYLGGVEAVFSEKKRLLEKVPGFGPNAAKQIVSSDALQQAEKELNFVTKHQIDVLFYLDEKYPYRLKECNDAPLLMYSKGKIDLNVPKVVAIVGTRSATAYGKAITEQFVEQAKLHDPSLLVVSGLAYGIDIYAHKAALKNELNTVAVFGNGMDTIYPAVHRNTAAQIINSGTLLTEFRQGTKPDRQNFVKRNRIVAGMSDAVVVVESGAKGGSLITANLAISYNRDVFAFPGNVGEVNSVGCNSLIKTNRAALIESFGDLEYGMGWTRENSTKAKRRLPDNLSESEQLLLKTIRNCPNADLNLLSRSSGIALSELSSQLFELEMKSIIRKVPGNVFVII